MTSADAVQAYPGALGEGSSDMVAILEIVFLIVCVVLGLWWFTRTNIYRARRRSGFHEPSQVDQTKGGFNPEGGSGRL